MLQVGKSEFLITDESMDSTGGTHDDVRMSFLVRQEIDVLLNRRSTVEDRDLDIGQELGETVVFVLDLECQLAGVAHDKDGCNARLRFLIHLLESSQDEDGSLSETGLGLTEDIVSEDGLGNGNLLDCGEKNMSEWNLKRSKRSGRGSVRPSSAHTTNPRNTILSLSFSNPMALQCFFIACNLYSDRGSPGRA